MSGWDYYTWMRFALYFMELVACVTGFIFWRKISGGYWRYFPFYLGFIFLMEITAQFSGPRLNDFIVNSVLIPVQFLFLYWIFFRYFTKKTDRRLTIVAAAVFLAAWLGEEIWLNKISASFVSLSYMAGNLLLLVVVILFFIRFTLSNEILYYHTSMMFWVCMGVLFFYLFTMPFYGLWNNLARYHPHFFNQYWTAAMILDFCMYGFFILAFIWSKPK